MEKQVILDSVQQRYGEVARGGLTNDSEAVRAIAQAFGYSEEDLAALPPQANMGLSCGNPVALAGLREGEVVVDLGCGGGLDVLLAARRVGPAGKAIGIDMTPAMIERARAGAAQVGAANVEFHLAQIDQLPLPDNSVDCILSNCVINLAPDKAAVFREIVRVLKPGGRMVVSDIALKQSLPPEVARDLAAYVGCVSGALLASDYERMLREAGLESVVVQDTGADLRTYAQAAGSGCCGSSEGCGAEAGGGGVHEGLAALLTEFDANAYAASVRVHALKPKTMHNERTAFRGATTMSRIQVYDKPMCCSTGICGPEVDPVLPRFAADLQWLAEQGHQVERFNLAQQPEAFVGHPQVQQTLMAEGASCLPLILVDGRIVSRQGYPTRDELAAWATGNAGPAVLPVMKSAGSCCGGESFC